MDAVGLLLATPMTDANRAETIRAALTGQPHPFVDLFRCYLRHLWGAGVKMPRNKTPDFYDDLLGRPFGEWRTVFDYEGYQDRLTAAAYYKLEGPLENFVCAISQELPVVPVGTPDGRIYNMVDIHSWLTRSPTDPLTRRPLYMHDLVGFSADDVNIFLNDKEPRNEAERVLQANWRTARGKFLYDRGDGIGGALLGHPESLSFMVDRIRESLSDDWYGPLSCCARVKARAICELARAVPALREAATECLGMFAAQRLEDLPKALAYFDEVDKPELKFKALIHFFHLDEDNEQVRDELVRLSLKMTEEFELSSETEDVFLLVAECAFHGKWGIEQDYALSRRLLEKVASFDLSDDTMRCRLAFMYIKGLGGAYRRAQGFEILEGVRSVESMRMLRVFDLGASEMQFVDPAQVRAQERKREAEKRREELIPSDRAPRRQRADSVEIIDPPF
jgi:hypothetical protein